MRKRMKTESQQDEVKKEGEKKEAEAAYGPSHGAQKAVAVRKEKEEEETSPTEETSPPPARLDELLPPLPPLHPLDAASAATKAELSDMGSPLVCLC